MRHSNTSVKTYPPIPSHAITHAIFLSIPNNTHQVSYHLVLVLLLDIRLGTTLLRLANVVSLLGSSLGLTVAS